MQTGFILPLEMSFQQLPIVKGTALRHKDDEPEEDSRNSINTETMHIVRVLGSSHCHPISSDGCWKSSTHTWIAYINCETHSEISLSMLLLDSPQICNTELVQSGNTYISLHISILPRTTNVQMYYHSMTKNHQEFESHQEIWEQK